MSATFDDHLDDVEFCAYCGRQFTRDNPPSDENPRRHVGCVEGTA